MKIHRIVTTILLVAINCCIGAFAAPSPSQYSVDVTVTTPKNVRTGKVYVSGTSVRTDTTDNKGRSMISIHNADNKEFYLVFPKSKTYRVYNIDKLAQQANIDQPVVPSQIKGEPLGVENVAGQVCEKLRYQKGKKVGFVWVNKQNGLPVMMMSEDQKYKAEYSSPAVGPQAASLFSPPEGFKRVEAGNTEL